MTEVTYPDTTAWRSPEGLAEAKILKLITGETHPEVVAEIATSVVFDVLGEPDRDMVSAGVEALDRATGRRAIEQRELVTMVFQAMLRQARTR
jgi:hypothetical protein